MKKLTIFLGVILFIALKSVVFAAEETKAPPKIPQQCKASAYKIEEGTSAFGAILKQAKSLLDELKSSDENDADKTDPKNNAFENSYAWLREKTNIDEFFASFDSLRASACLRKDVNDLEDEISEIETAYQKGLKDGQINADDRTRISFQMNTLKQEVKNLRKCGDVDGSVYFELRYTKAQCEPEEKKMFESVKTSFSTMKEKLKDLFSKEGWKDVLNFDQWKNITATTEQEKKGIEDEALSWLSRNSIPSLLKLPPKEETFRSDLELQKPLEDAENLSDDEAAKRAAEMKRAALANPDRSAAFEGYDDSFKKQEALEKYGKHTIYDLLIVLLDTSGAKYWKDQVKASESSVTAQKKQLDDLTKALKNLNNIQAKNVQN